MPSPYYLVVYVIAMLLFVIYASVEMRLTLKEAVKFGTALLLGAPLALLLLWTLTAASFAM